MGSQLLDPSGPEGVHPTVIPDVGTRAAMTPQFDVIEMRSFADSEDGDELMLTAVKRALPAIRLDPDHDVQDLVIGQSAGLGDVGHVAPVTADIMDRSRIRDPCRIAKRTHQEIDILGTGHFAG